MRYLTEKPAATAIKGHNSFEAAVRANADSPRTALAAATTDFIRNEVLLSACWEDAQAAFVLSGRKCLHLLVSKGEVIWQCVTGEECSRLSLQWRSDSEVIALVQYLPDGQSLLTRVDRRGLTMRTTGKRIRRLVVDEFGVYLHFVDDLTYLAFHAIETINPKGEIMTWCEDRD